MIACPFCASARTERVGLWGGQMITAQWRCAACGSYFEAVREDFDDDAAPARGSAAAQGPDRDRHLGDRHQR